MSDKLRSSFIDELKRRNVFRIGLAYLVAAWALIQIADTIFPRIGLPDQAITFVIVLLAIGLIPALIIAWVYELTPGGVIRDEGSTQPESGARKRTLRTFDYVVVSVLTIMVTVYAFNEFGPKSENEPEQDAPRRSASIAVLPFENRSADPADVYFVDGIHDDILSSLSNIGSLKVISRTSVERFRNSDKSIREIGAELNVAVILEGGVQRAGDAVRINVNLVDVASEASEWSETFNRELTVKNIFAIQSEISETIATSLRSTLTPEEQSRIETVPTDSLQAYEAYLLGNQRIQRRTGAALEQAVEFFKEAISLDPEFALAWVGLADSYTLLTNYGRKNPDEMMPLAIDAAEKAIELDPNAGEAYASLAGIHHEFRTDTDPEPLFLRAIELSPNYAPARQWYGELLDRQDRVDEALTQFQRALELDPLSPILNAQLGDFFLWRGRLDEAGPPILRAIEIDPRFAIGYTNLALLNRKRGRWDEALLAAEQAQRFNPPTVQVLALQAEFLIQLGDFAEAERRIKEVSGLYPDHPQVPFATAMLHATRNDDEAVEFARRTWENHRIRGFNKIILTNDHLRTGRYKDALELLESIEGYGKLPSAPTASAINGNNAVNALVYADVLKKAGREADAAIWIELLLNFFAEDLRANPIDSTAPQEQFRFLGALASTHALNGDKVSALAAIREAVDLGWSNYWFYFFDHEPNLDLIRDEPEFQAMREEVRARMDEQLANYRAKKAEEI